MKTGEYRQLLGKGGTHKLTMEELLALINDNLAGLIGSGSVNIVDQNGTIIATISAPGTYTVARATGIVDIGTGTDMIIDIG